jgi:hypothetical protein
MTRRGLVSVIICTYKREDMLALAVQSALKQSYSNLEVIVSDMSRFRRICGVGSMRSSMGGRWSTHSTFPLLLPT